MADLFAPTIRFTRPTTWADDGPSGLSISRMPLRNMTITAGREKRDKIGEEIALLWFIL
jgi:hypothetical protein